MKAFIEKTFLMSNQTGEHLFHQYVENVPMTDYHSKLKPEQILQNNSFENITQFWLQDSAKHSLMRMNGIEEKYITGDASDYEKFTAFCSTVEKAIGHPLYHVSHLELQRYFGYLGPITTQSAEAIWDQCNRRLAYPNMCVKRIIDESPIETINCVTDILDSLEPFRTLKADSSFSTNLLPIFCPNHALHIEDENFSSYMENLSQAVDHKIDSFDTLIAVLSSRLNDFIKTGCVSSSQDLLQISPDTLSGKEPSAIFKKALANEPLSYDEINHYHICFLKQLGEIYAKHNILMQINYKSALENGMDLLIENLSQEHPDLRFVLSSPTPGKDAQIAKATLAPIQFGSTYWMEDSYEGMHSKLLDIAHHHILGNYIGIASDSANLLTPAYFEYFRRTFCNLLGYWIENGEYPKNLPVLESMIRNIIYQNAKDYFHFS